MNELSIHTIADIQPRVHHNGTPKLPILGFSQICDISLQALPANPPSSFKDHRKAKNPYLSRYGERWVGKLKSSTAMLKFCCITNIIRFIMNEAEKLMKWSLHDDDFFIVHNALVLMSAKEKINWMRKNGYLHRCLLPLNGMQYGTPYAGRTIGNRPEFMPLDHLLNRDILKSLRMHSVLSRYIADGEETDEEERNMCFSYSAPREIARGLKRIWDSKMGTPSSVRIIKDVGLSLKALEIVYRKNGAAVEGI